jgi:hypothetical protein
MRLDATSLLRCVQLAGCPSVAELDAALRGLLGRHAHWFWFWCLLMVVDG